MGGGGVGGWLKCILLVPNLRPSFSAVIDSLISNIYILLFSKRKQQSNTENVNNLKFDEHINYIVNRANRLVGPIKRTFKSLDKDLFLILYKSLIRYILDYGGSVYYPYTKKNIQMIENVQCRATRILPE